MPELPEIAALERFLAEHAVGAVVGRVDVAALSVLKTFDPPITALSGRDVLEAGHWGKHLGLNCGGLWLITHLSRGGWLRWIDEPSPNPPKPGKGPLALRVHFFTAEGATPAFDLTEAGTKNASRSGWSRTRGRSRASRGWVPTRWRSPRRSSPRFCAAPRSGSRPPSPTRRCWRASATPTPTRSCTRRSFPRSPPCAPSPRKTVLLYEAMRAILTDAVNRSVGQDAARLKGEKRSGMQVHARTGLPCPVCGDTVREVAYADKSFQYCPTCQTGGKILADRRMSRLLK